MPGLATHLVQEINVGTVYIGEILPSWECHESMLLGLGLPYSLGTLALPRNEFYLEDFSHGLYFKWTVNRSLE